ncbi:MAG: gas vesicle protein GvpO [bacterium]
MIEKHSIPDQMDILATYDVVLDEDGKLLEFNRTGLRKRCDTEVGVEE